MRCYQKPNKLLVDGESLGQRVGRKKKKKKKKKEKKEKKKKKKIRGN